MQVNQSLPPELIRIVISVVVVVGFTFLNVLLLGYAERKISARIMRRPGPMEVGPQGILQLLVDGVKLVAKQFIVPSEAGTLFRIAPLLAFMPVGLSFIVIPFSTRLQVRDLDTGLVFMLAVMSLNTFAILVAGWTSNSKYSLFG